MLDWGALLHATLSTIFVEWCLAVVFLTLGATLLFCVALHGPLQPDLCHRLQDLIRNTAKPLIDLFGGWGE